MKIFQILKLTYIFTLSSESKYIPDIKTDIYFDSEDSVKIIKEESKDNVPQKMDLKYSYIHIFTDMGIHTLPLLIYGARIKYEDIQRIQKDICKDEDEDYYDLWEELKILRVSPYAHGENNDCNWYYVIHKFKNSYSFEKPTMFEEINIPKYDEKQVKKDLLNLGIKKYKIGFYVDAHLG